MCPVGVCDLATAAAEESMWKFYSTVSESVAKWNKMLLSRRIPSRSELKCCSILNSLEFSELDIIYLLGLPHMPSRNKTGFMSIHFLCLPIKTVE